MNDLWELPTSWCWTPIGDATDVIGGGTPSTTNPKNFGGSIPWITPADMSGYLGKTISGGARFISEQGLADSGARWLPQGAVLFSSRAPIGYVAVASRPITTNQGFKSFVPGNGLNSEYLYYWLTSAKQHAEALASGTTFLELSGAKAALIPLPLAPTAEQTRIVEKLEELLSDLDVGVAELKAAQVKLGQYRQSLLKAAVECSDSGEPYQKLTLGELVTSIGQGWSPKCERESATDDEQWAVMKTTAIQPLAFDGSHNKALPVGLKPRVNLELKLGDLLVTRAGPRNRVGITCLVRKTRPKLILCDKAYRIRCDEKRIDPNFLELVLNAPHMVQRIDELKTGISDSGLNLTQDRFFTLDIPLPTIEEQRIIVERINAQVAMIQDQEQSLEVAFKQSAAQRKNILKAAFSGQLVPQDPNDEPASVLLERIRTERVERDAVKKPRGRKAKELA